MTPFKNTLKTGRYLFFLALLYSCAQEKDHQSSGS